MATFVKDFKNKNRTLDESHPIMSCFFEVIFLVGGLGPNGLDVRFNKISGMSSKIETQNIRVGGENQQMRPLPQQVVHENLVLERGVARGSILNWEFNLAMTNFMFFPGNALVIANDNNDNIQAAWLFRNTYPVAWKVSDLCSDDSKALIETMELAYTHFWSLRY